MLQFALPLVLSACEVAAHSDWRPTPGWTVSEASSWTVAGDADRWHVVDPSSPSALWFENRFENRFGNPYQLRRTPRPPLDAPTVVVREPGYYEQVGDEAVWVPEAYRTEPQNLITRHAGATRHRDQPPAREAPVLQRDRINVQAQDPRSADAAPAR